MRVRDLWVLMVFLVATSCQNSKPASESFDSSTPKTCTIDKDCETIKSTSMTPFCAGGVCQTCVSDAQCKDPKQGNYCYRGNCVACKNSGHCNSSNPYCIKNECQSKCATDSDCIEVNGNKPACSAAGVCVSCTEDSQCEAVNPQKPYCNNNTCSASCSSPTQCQNYAGVKYPQGNCISSKCIYATSQSVCPTPFSFDSNTTLCGCSSDEQCVLYDPSRPYCNGLSLRRHLGTCSRYCENNNQCPEAPQSSALPACYRGVCKTKCETDYDCKNSYLSRPFCNGGICDENCVNNDQCKIFNIDKPQCDNGICVQNNPKCKSHADCSGTTPICYAGNCVGCKKDLQDPPFQDRPLDKHKKVNDLIGKVNYSALYYSCQGKDPFQPYCKDDGSCSGCKQDGDCDQYPATPACYKPYGSCGCTTDKQCQDFYGSSFPAAYDPKCVEGVCKGNCYADGKTVNLLTQGCCPASGSSSQIYQQGLEACCSVGDGNGAWKVTKGENLRCCPETGKGYGFAFNPLTQKCCGSGVTTVGNTEITPIEAYSCCFNQAYLPSVNSLCCGQSLVLDNANLACCDPGDGAFQQPYNTVNQLCCQANKYLICKCSAGVYDINPGCPDDANCCSINVVPNCQNLQTPPKCS